MKDKITFAVAILIVMALMVVGLQYWLGDVDTSVPAVPAVAVSAPAQQPQASPVSLSLGTLLALVIEFVVAVFILPILLIGLICTDMFARTTVRSDRWTVTGRIIDQTYTSVPVGMIPNPIAQSSGIVFLWPIVIALYYWMAYGMMAAYPLHTIWEPLASKIISLF